MVAIFLKTINIKMKQKNNKLKLNLLFVLIFIVISVLNYILCFNSALFTLKVLSVGNLLMFLTTLLSFNIGFSAALSDNPNKFVRAIMGGGFLKFGLTIIIALIYFITNKGHILKTDIFNLMFIYIIYTTLETVLLAKNSRKHNKK